MIPEAVIAIEAASKGFSMLSDHDTGRLLRTLVATKPAARVLELGTGTGLATAWLLDGMDKKSSLVTVDNNAELTAVAQHYLGNDPRLSIYTQDGFDFLETLQGQQFDLVFADTWPGKIEKPELALNLVAPGGIYFIDDLKLAWTEEKDLAQPVSDLIKSAWEGQRRLIPKLEQSSEFYCTTLNWSTGIMICTKKP
ncbi:MAG: class I SAM-dependent methyltransferase [Trueperaceae bacterium]|nr:class I SAM-dependent methyltransferase [Trueperaceae bacterium]